MKSLRNTLDTLAFQVQTLKSLADRQAFPPPLLLSKRVNSIRPSPLKENVDYIQRAKNVWLGFLQGKNDAPTLQNVRYLCWEHEISASKPFCDYLTRLHPRLRKRGVSGLVASYLRQFENAKNNPQIRSRYLSLFQMDWDCPDYLLRIRRFLLSPDLEQKLTDEVVARRAVPSEVERQCFDLVLAGSTLSSSILSRLAITKGHLLISSNQEDREWFSNKIVPLFDQMQLVKMVEKMVSAIDTSTSAADKNIAKKFILDEKRLGDPRIPQNKKHWDSCNTKVVQQITSWFSSDDIRLFFDCVFDGRTDNQRRKEFWQQYAHLVQRTRVVLCNEDRKRLARMLDEQGYTASPIIGSLSEFDNRGSVFFMDFGTVIAVEYSLPNNKCWFHEPSKSPLFKTTDNFWKKSFRRSEFTFLCEGRSHVQGWHSKFADYLSSQYGLPNPFRSFRGY